MSASFIAVPLNLWMSPAQSEQFAATGAVSTTSQPKIQESLAAMKPATGSHLVFVDASAGETVRVLAVGLVTNTAGTYGWKQTAVRFSMVLPGLDFKVRVLSATEAQALMENLAGVSMPIGVAVPAPATGRAPDVTEDDEEDDGYLEHSSRRPSDEGRAIAALPATKPTDGVAKNVILYGPPGTGKTFSTAARTLALLGVADIPDDTGACAETFRLFQRAGRVEFVTFHQSYGYEEFVEGLRPVLDDSSGEVKYELHKGVFLRIVERARAAFIRVASGTSVPSDDFEVGWAALILRIQNAGGALSIESAKGHPGKLTVDRDGSVRVHIDLEDPTRLDSVKKDFPIRKEVAQRLWEQRTPLGPKPTTTALGSAAKSAVSGHYLHPFYRQLIASVPAQAPSASGAPETVPQFVLVIDEINRGNISKILGELITLIEPDKRLGGPFALELPLTYSPGKRFGVPPNLHILGTMNTADRSIALLDIALRRRFSFEAVMPNPATLKTLIGDAELAKLAAALLLALNRRIRRLLDEDHQIGHAYLKDLDSRGALREVFVTKLAPLLREYFHGSPESVAAVLGCGYDGAKTSNPKPLLVLAEVDNEPLPGLDDDDPRRVHEWSADFLRASEDELRAFFRGVLGNSERGWLDSPSW